MTVMLGDCPNCGSPDARCAEAPEMGAIKCCPDCKHPETLPPPTRTDVRVAVEQLRLAMLRLNRDAATLAEGLSTEDCALFLGMIQQQQDDLNAVAGYVGHVLGGRLGKRQTRWDDGMLAERTPAYRETWDRPAAAAAATADLTDHHDPQYAQGAKDTLRRLLEVARPDFRRSELRQYLGEALDEFCSREQTHYRVKVSLPEGTAP